MEWALYAGVGCVAGFFAGLLGLGGGAIVGPLLIVIFVSLLAFDPAASTYLAIGTAMAVIALTSFISASTHARGGNINWPFARLLAVGAVFGAWGGVHIALLIPASVLKFFLALFLLFNAFTFLLASRKNTDNQPTQTPAKPSVLTAAIAIPIGAVSAAIGIGGGIVMVPYLTRRNIPIRQAIGTSAFVVMPLSITAAVAYALSAEAQNQPLPDGTLGFVYLPALAGITVFSLITAHFGATLTAVLSAKILRRLFALLMFLIACRLFSIILFSF